MWCLSKLSDDIASISTPLGTDDFVQLDADLQQLQKLAADLPGFFHEDLPHLAQ